MQTALGILDALEHGATSRAARVGATPANFIESSLEVLIASIMPKKPRCKAPPGG